MYAVRYLAVSWLLIGACAHTSDTPTRAPAPASVPTANLGPGPELADAPPAHPVLLAYRETLRTFLLDEESAALDAVATDGTIGGDSQRLRYIAADRTIRELLPLALEAQGDASLDAHAARLRELPPLLNRDVDYVVQPVVAEAMRALRVHRGGGRPAPPAPIEGEGAAQLEVASGDPLLLPPSTDPLATAAGNGASARDAAEHADAMAEYAEAYSSAFGTSSLGADAATAAASDAIDAGFLVRAAIEVYGADRGRVLRTAMSTLSAMADAARRRERMPLPDRDRASDTTDP